MAIGLGIHGEPGIGETGVPTADELADALVARLLDELPDDIDAATGARVVAVLNGLGSVKYEELFVVYGRSRGCWPRPGSRSSTRGRRSLSPASTWPASR